MTSATQQLYTPSDEIRLFREDLERGLLYDIPSLRIPRISEMKRLSTRLERQCSAPRSTWDPVVRSEGRAVPGVPTSPRMLKRIAHSTPALLQHARAAGRARPSLQAKAAQEASDAGAKGPSAAAGDSSSASPTQWQSAGYRRALPTSPTRRRLAAGRPIGEVTGFQRLFAAAHTNGGHISSVSIPSKNSPMMGYVALERDASGYKEETQTMCEALRPIGFAGPSHVRTPCGIDKMQEVTPWVPGSWPSSISCSASPTSFPASPSVCPSTPAPWNYTGSHSSTACRSASLAGIAPPDHEFQALFSSDMKVGEDKAQHVSRPPWGRMSHSVSVLEVRRALEMARENLAKPGGGTRENVAVEEMLAFAFEQMVGEPLINEGEIVIPEETKVRLLGPELGAQAGKDLSADRPRPSKSFETIGGLDGDYNPYADTRIDNSPRSSYRTSRALSPVHSAHSTTVPSIPSRPGGPLTLIGPASTGWESSLRTSPTSPSPIARRAVPLLSTGEPVGVPLGEELLRKNSTNLMKEASPQENQTSCAVGAGIHSDPLPHAIESHESGASKEGSQFLKGASSHQPGTARRTLRPTTPASIPAGGASRGFEGERVSDSLCSGSSLLAKPHEMTAPSHTRAAANPSGNSRPRRLSQSVNQPAIIRHDEMAPATVPAVIRLAPKPRSALSSGRRARSPVLPHPNIRRNPKGAQGLSSSACTESVTGKREGGNGETRPTPFNGSACSVPSMAPCSPVASSAKVWDFGIGGELQPMTEASPLTPPRESDW